MRLVAPVLIQISCTLLSNVEGKAISSRVGCEMFSRTTPPILAVFAVPPSVPAETKGTLRGGQINVNVDLVKAL